jgi:hypothetical protein
MMTDTVGTAIITGLATVAAGVMALAGGMWGHWLEQRQANKRPFLEKQLALCFEAVEMESRLAAARDPKEWEDARLTFWRLFWGPLSMVEDQRVKEAMEAFGNILTTIPIPRRGEISASELPRHDLEQTSYRLAHAARDLVISSWRIRDLPQLQGEPKTAETKFREG